MKSLRKTIREILLENQAHYDKLAKLMCSGDFDSISQAVELAETMGYIEMDKYEPREYPSEIGHMWKFIADKPLWEAIDEEWDKMYGKTKRYCSVHQWTFNRMVAILLYLPKES